MSGGPTARGGPGTSDRRIPPQAQVSALVLGAGMGLRLGLGPKAFLQLAATETLLERAVALVLPYAAQVLVGVPPPDVRRATALVDGMGESVTVMAGGETRQQTVGRLLERAERPLVLVHEVARPMVTPDLVEAVLAAAAQSGAASLYLPLEARDAMALSGDDGSLQSILPRSRLVTLQTPHAYRRDVLVAAHQRAEKAGWHEDGTAAIVSRAGYAVSLVRGSPENVKITYPNDLPAPTDAGS